MTATPYNAAEIAALARAVRDAHHLTNMEAADLCALLAAYDPNPQPLLAARTWLRVAAYEGGTDLDIAARHANGNS